MAGSDKLSARQRRAERKRQGLVYLRAWVTPEQAAAIEAVLAGRAVHYDPASATPPTPAAKPGRSTPTSAKSDKLRFRKKAGHPGAWTVWLGNAELGTVYKNTVDEIPRPLTVWIAYRPGGRSSRHVSRQLAAEALRHEYQQF